jgi:DNA modification methylase
VLDKIHNENCLNTLERLEDNYIDMVITSPPYDNLRDYKGFEFEFEKIANELYRTVKKGGVVIWVVGDSTVKGSETGTSFKQALYFKEIGFNLNDTMIYYKNNPIPTNGKRYHQHFEYIFCLSKGTPNTFNPIMEDCKYTGVANMKNRGKSGDKNYKKIERTKTKKVGNVFFYSVGGGISTKDKIAFEHPAIFPEKLVEDQIITWSNENDIVYDPFMGSGTVAKIARVHNRKWFGSEVSKDYCKIAEKRLNLNQN